MAAPAAHPPAVFTLEQAKPARLAVFVSGGGSNMKALHAAIQRGAINAVIAVREGGEGEGRACKPAAAPCDARPHRARSATAAATTSTSLTPPCPLRAPQVVVSDRPGCGGVEYAQQHDIPVLTYPIPKGGASGLTDAQLVDGLKTTYMVDFVILAGYLKARGRGMRTRRLPLRTSAPCVVACNPLPAPCAPRTRSSSLQTSCAPSRAPCSTSTPACCPPLAARACTASACTRRSLHRARGAWRGRRGPPLHSKGGLAAQPCARALAHAVQCVPRTWEHARTMRAPPPCRRWSGPTVHFVDEEFDTGPILAQAVVPVRPTDSPKQLAARVLAEVREGRGTGGPVRAGLALTACHRHGSSTGAEGGGGRRQMVRRWALPVRLVRLQHTHLTPAAMARHTAAPAHLAPRR